MAKQSFLDFMNVKYVFLNEDENKEKVSAEHGGKRIINSKTHLETLKIYCN